MLKTSIVHIVGDQILFDDHSIVKHNVDGQRLLDIKKG